MRCSAPLLATFILCSATIAPALASGPASPGDLTVTDKDGSVVDMPLRHTKVRIEVTGFVESTTIEQTFTNPFKTPVEAVYTFPLGDRAAVDDFELTVGDRTIRGEIQRTEQARATYAQARAQGYQAALLEQRRPNIFTQSVANLEPGLPVIVRLRTIETLRYERGTYRLAFPLVVAPRYTHSASATFAAPVMAPGTRSGHDVEIEATIDAGVPLRDVHSASHRIVMDRLGTASARVHLDEGDRIPNKDFLLQWSVDSERPAVGLLAHRDGLDGFFTLLVQPKAEIDPGEAAPKEITLVVDTSGSMWGMPLDASKRFIAKILHTLGPRDTFNIVRFSGDNEVFSAEPLPNDPAAIERAIAWVNRQQGGGGTEMLAAMRAAFARPVDPNRLRMVVFLTDGQIGDDDEILHEIGRVIGDARIYTVGIGTSVNRYLLDRMADLGRGAFVTIRPDESADDALEAFRSWVSLPYLTDLTVDWGSLPVVDVAPDPIRDLCSGQTLTIVGRYLNGASGDVVVRGKLGGRYWEHRQHVSLPDAQPKHAPLAALWARAKIENLLLSSPGATTESIRAEVTSLALDYRLMSPFTSFVAVDDRVVVNPSGVAPVVHQPLALPDQSSFVGIFGANGPAAFALGNGGASAPPAPPPPVTFPKGAGGLRVHVVDNSDKAPVIGAAVTLSSTAQLVATATILTDVQGLAQFPVLRAGAGYVFSVAMDGYTAVRQQVDVTNGLYKEVSVALAPEHVEKVVVSGARTSVDLDKDQTVTSFSSDFVADLPSAGRFYQNVLSLAPGVQDPAGDGNPNVSGARERDFKTQVSGVSNVDPLKGAFLNRATQDSIEGLTVITAGAGAEFGRAQGGFAKIAAAEPAAAPDPLRLAALQVLADLADDGKLSSAEGKPALAALLAAQAQNGAIGNDTATHAIATWALSEAATALPKDPWVGAARTKAVDYLEALRLEDGWPRRPHTDVDSEATAWARFVMSMIRPECVRAIKPVASQPEELTRLRQAIDAAKSGLPAPESHGRTALDRLVATIGRGHLKLDNAS